MNDWYLYVVECSDGSLYTGITTDINRRLHEHNNTKRGAKYTRSRRPVSLVCVIDTYSSRSEASMYERAFKSLKRKEKLKVIDKHKPTPKFKENEIVLVGTWFVNPLKASRKVMGMILSVAGKKRSIYNKAGKYTGGKYRLDPRHVFFEKFEYRVLVEGKVIIVPENGIVRMY